MFNVTKPMARTRLATLAVSAVALMSFALLAGPVPASAADPESLTPMVHHHGHADRKGETIDQRIAALHASLKILPEQEAAWAAVAKTMTDNHAAMRALIAARQAEPPHNVTAVEDLKTYEKFTQAHVDGLKALIISFEALYGMMPDSQKAIADKVFQSFGAKAKPAKG